MSKAQIGKKQTQETKSKIGSSNTGKKRTDVQRQTISEAKKLAAAEKFKKMFYERLSSWKSNPELNKQWRYDISRKYRDGSLLQEYVDLLNSIPEWAWSSRRKTSIP